MGRFIQPVAVRREGDRLIPELAESVPTPPADEPTDDAPNNPDDPE